MNYRAVCIHTHKVYQKYVRRAFDIDGRLRTFFSAEEVLIFRMLQADSGIVISGSFAVQFFGRIDYPSSDLDLYVEFRHGYRLCAWLVSVGFSCISSSNFTRQYFTGKFDVEENGSGDYDGVGCPDFHTVLTFSREERKIQVMVTKRCVMSIILSFHLSTCVYHIVRIRQQLSRFHFI
jgi:hypothetical protein